MICWMCGMEVAEAYQAEIGGEVVCRWCAGLEDDEEMEGDEDAD